MAERKNPELDAQHQAILRRMMQLPENKQCADCKGPSPRWASTNLGIFICISCSGIHRKLGTHISQVRSVTLDTWTPAQVAHFQKFGNAKAAQYFEACLPPDFRRPTSGDSMQVERFIRDKYERKRFITVENGGLGGASSDHRDPLRAARDATRDAISSHAARYDDASISRRTPIGLSYGDRFRGGQQASIGFARPEQTGTFNAGRKVGLGPRPGNAIQRAQTLKQIMNMGFSAETASRAVEVSGGDLQRAVDWVLEHPDTSTAPATDKTKEAVQDLLSFEDVTPASKGASNFRTNIMDSEQLLANQTQPAKPAPAKVSQHSAEDFADFGAFESALPSAAASTPKNSTQNAKSSLGSSIASLYSQNQSATASAPFSPGRAALATTSPQRASPRLPTMTSPTGRVQKGMNMNSSFKLNAVPSQAANHAQGKLSSPSQTVRQGVGLSPGTYIPNGAAKLNMFTTDSHAPLSPPPPPTMQETVTADPNAPPPPDTPPPGFNRATRPGSENTPTSPAPSKNTLLNSSPQLKSSPLGIGATQTAAKVATENSEDPFAALSMFALNSAKAQQKSRTQKNKQETQNAQKSFSTALPSSSQPKNNSTEVNLDDLLG